MILILRDRVVNIWYMCTSVVVAVLIVIVITSVARTVAIKMWSEPVVAKNRPPNHWRDTVRVTLKMR